MRFEHDADHPLLSSTYIMRLSMLDFRRFKPYQKYAPETRTAYRAQQYAVHKGPRRTRG